MAMNHLMSIAKRAQQEASEPHIKEAGDLFAIYERLRDERQALEKDVDPNIYTVALTRANPKFAHQWPVVVKIIAVRGQFFTAAFKAYMHYARNTSVDGLATKKLEELDPRVKADRKLREAPRVDRTVETFDEAGVSTGYEVVPAPDLPEPYEPPKQLLLEARLRARAEHESYYTYLTIIEDAKSRWPRDYKRRFPSALKDALAAEAYKELQVTEQENAEAAKLAAEREEAIRAEHKAHLRMWLQRSIAMPGHDETFAALTRPTEFSLGSAAASCEEWVQKA